ncbi:hypothetical protein Raf01_19580 [Rugosimonospora africana]|uniref:DUF3710 domain-containing protein n=1 Tax=Rugosimonospora africana TaxID=556532 RepID=A0A8J3QNL1_9ACTN|nr:hypothetical protein Raf01_19580 [Rugosimonospora africana]
MIFSRGRGNGGRHKKGEDAGRGAHRSPAAQPSDDADELVERAAGGGSRPGPYDITEAPSGVERLDLGSLQIPAVNGVEIRVQANPDGSIGQIVLVHESSALQLGVFAAPRSSGIWDEVREEIRTQLTSDGAKADEVGGEYGTELRARIRTPDGPADVRFIGVDGPRWMVRAVYQGPAAADPSAAGPLADCLRELVVDRGREAMPVREALPLRLPREAAEQAHIQQQGQAQSQGRAQVQPGGQARAQVQLGDSPLAPQPSTTSSTDATAVNGSTPQSGKRGSSRTRRSR